MGNHRERLAGQHRAVAGQAVDVGVLDDAGHQYQAGHQTDDHGIPEGARHGDQRLALGVAGFGRGSHQRSRAHAGFVGEQAPGEAVAAGHGDGAADEAAAHGPGAEGGADDDPDGLAHHVGIHDQYDQAAQEVEQRHKRHQHLRNPGDGLDATDDHQRHQHAEHDGHRDGRDVEVLGDIAHHGIRLHHATDAKAAQRSQQRKQYAGPAGVQAPVQRVHRPADHRAVLALHAVLDGDDGLGILRGDAEHACQPHPQHRPRSAKGDGRADADDIAGANGRRQRGGQRAELGHITLAALVPGHAHANRLEDVLLDEARSDRHEDVRPKEQYDQRPAPEKAVQLADNISHFLSPLYYLYHQNILPHSFVPGKRRIVVAFSHRLNII